MTKTEFKLHHKVCEFTDAFPSPSDKTLFAVAFRGTAYQAEAERLLEETRKLEKQFLYLRDTIYHNTIEQIEAEKLVNFRSE